MISSFGQEGPHPTQVPAHPTPMFRTNPSWGEVPGQPGPLGGRRKWQLSSSCMTLDSLVHLSESQFPSP